MKRIDFDDGIGAVEDKHGAGKDGFTNGTPEDPSTGTIPQDYWFDHVQEEIANVIEGAGIALNDGLYDQLSDIVLARNLASPDDARTMGNTLRFFIASADNELPRIEETDALPSLHKRLLWHSDDIRLYQDANGYWFTHNATFNNSTRVWGATGPTPRAVQFDVLNGTTVYYEDSFGVADQFVTRSRRREAQAYVQAGPTANGGAIAVDNEVNVQDAEVVTGSSGEVQVNFSTTMPSADYRAMAIADAAGASRSDIACNLGPRSTNYCRVYLYNTASGAPINVNASSFAFHIFCDWG